MTGDIPSYHLSDVSPEIQEELVKDLPWAMERQEEYLVLSKMREERIKEMSQQMYNENVAKMSKERIKEMVNSCTMKMSQRWEQKGRQR